MCGESIVKIFIPAKTNYEFRMFKITKYFKYGFKLNFMLL